MGPPASREQGLKLIVGSEVRLAGGVHLVLLSADRDGYGDLCSLITAGQRAAIEIYIDPPAGKLRRQARSP